MQSIGWDGSPRFLQERSWGCAPFSPINNSYHRRSCSYRKLPQQLLKLTVLKLDGSSFDVQIARTASVLELKQAVENVFRQSPKEGEGKISWSHVWGHFCLSYEGNKLDDDKAYLKSFGIRDGDQLQFIRHRSMNNCPPTQRRPRNSISPTGSDAHKAGNEDSDSEHEDDNSVAGNTYESGDVDNFLAFPEFKLAHFLKGWLSYTRLWCGQRRRREDGTRPFSRLGGKSAEWD